MNFMKLNCRKNVAVQDRDPLVHESQIHLSLSQILALVIVAESSEPIFKMKSSPNAEIRGPTSSHAFVQKEILLSSPICHATKDRIKCLNARILRHTHEHLVGRV